MLAGWLHDDGVAAGDREMERLKEVLDHEPPAWASGGSSGPARWRIVLTNKLRRYRDVRGVDEYLARVAEAASGAGPAATGAGAAIEQPGATPTDRPGGRDDADVFISHATADKADVARPLAENLRRRGYRVWLDESESRIGDSLLARVDAGLANCRFGVVILSASFFKRAWPRHELEGLVTRELDGELVVLPVWHKVTQAQGGVFAAVGQSAGGGHGQRDRRGGPEHCGPPRSSQPSAGGHFGWPWRRRQWPVGGGRDGSIGDGPGCRRPTRH